MTIQDLLEALIDNLTDLEWENAARAILPDDDVSDTLDMLGALGAELN